MQDKVGDYSVRAGGTAVKFWPLTPGSTVASATPLPPTLPVAPNGTNTLAVPPAFALFDVVIHRTEDPIVTSSITEPALLTQITAMPTVSTMPIMRESDHSSRICFALPANSETKFEGTLRLVVHRGATGSGTATTLDLPIKAAQNTVVSNLFVFFVVHVHPPQTYAWVKLKVVDHVANSTFLPSAAVQLNVLRDNSTFQNINRRVAFVTGADGYIASSGRNVIGVPIGWPLNFKATLAGRVNRGHLVKLTANNVHDNTAPFEPSPLPMMRSSNTDLASKRILLDAGHGVVYAYAPARRSQEWYVAHKLVDRIAAILTTEHGMPAANLFFTRTAGFGLIEPTQMGANGAPEAGDGRYEFDLPRRRIRVRTAGMTLLNLSDLLLTGHSGDTNTVQPVPAVERTRLLTINTVTMTTITTRLNAHLQAQSKRVRANSIRWDDASNRYVYTIEPIAPATGAAADQLLPIRTDDWFTVDSPMIRVLADRSARWSLAHEIGSASITTQSGVSFTTAARAALRAAGAVDYMRDKIISYSDVVAPNQWLDHGIKAWGPTDRLTFINNTPCDLYLTLHENAGGGRGGMTLFSVQGGANAPPDDQIRIGKVFAKYMDWFDLGLRQDGLAQELAGNPAAMLHSGNQVRDKYAYFESEFMDALNPDNPNQFRFEQMIGSANIDRFARQLVDGIVEELLGRQADLDTVTFKGTFTLW